MFGDLRKTGLPFSDVTSNKAFDLTPYANQLLMAYNSTMV